MRPIKRVYNLFSSVHGVACFSSVWSTDGPDSAVALPEEAVPHGEPRALPEPDAGVEEDAGGGLLGAQCGHYVLILAHEPAAIHVLLQHAVVEPRPRRDGRGVPTEHAPADPVLRDGIVEVPAQLGWGELSDEEEVDSRVVDRGDQGPRVTELRGSHIARVNPKEIVRCEWIHVDGLGHEIRLEIPGEVQLITFVY